MFIAESSAPQEILQKIIRLLLNVIVNCADIVDRNGIKDILIPVKASFARLRHLQIVGNRTARAKEKEHRIRQPKVMRAVDPSPNQIIIGNLSINQP